MSKPKVFISYRRADAIDAVRALYFQLRLRFGLSQVFMDVSAIQAGDVWPQRLRQALADASVVLVVVGPTWLKSADEYGRRRLDADDDWVRIEVQTALESDATVIPVLVGGVRELPPSAALPGVLAPLRSRNGHVLNDASWENDVEALSRQLRDGHEFRLVDQHVVYPAPEKVVPALSDDAVFDALKSLPGWEPVETSIPGDYPKTRHELRRGLRFKTFEHAIGFLQLLVKPLSELDHHPRIENQWRTVFVHFTTWDVGNRITAVDVKAARLVNDIYEEFTAALKRDASGPRP